MDNFLGHPISYWIELNKRVKEIKAEDLLEEVVTLKGKLAFVEDRLEQINTILKK